jgi:hypothetical protein
MSLAHGFTQKNTDQNLANGLVPSQRLILKKNPFLVRLSVLSGRICKELLCL